MRGMSLDPEGLYRVLFDATEREPDTEVIDRPDRIQLRTPSSPLVQHNEVLRAVLVLASVSVDRDGTRVAR